MVTYPIQISSERADKRFNVREITWWIFIWKVFIITLLEPNRVKCICVLSYFLLSAETNVGNLSNGAIFMWYSQQNVRQLIYSRRKWPDLPPVISQSRSMSGCTLRILSLPTVESVLLASSTGKRKSFVACSLFIWNSECIIYSRAMIILYEKNAVIFRISDGYHLISSVITRINRCWYEVRETALSVAAFYCLAWHC